MADIFSGKGLTLQYNTDTGNRSPQGIGNVTINNVTEFPALTIQSETNNFETYDNEYKTVLLSDKSVEPFDIVVAYLPDDPTHQFLDEIAESQTVFQVIIQYQLDLEESQITYAIVNGYVTGTQLSGDKDQVVTKSYSFTPADVVARVMTMAAPLPVYQGDYGVGANTTGITAKYNAQAIDISNQNAQQQLTIFSDTAQNLSGAMVAAFGESSGAAEAAFMVSRGITIAQTVLSIQSALAQALATPWPQNLANYAQVASLGLSIISTAKGADAGQFHGGVDELPSSYDNKSFVLKAGERVVQPEANKKLTKFLDTQDKGGSTAGDITVNAPLIIQGDVAGDDKKFNEMLKKHANSVTQAVRSSQRRNS